MTITTEQNGSSITMHISGRLDTVTSPELEAAIAALPAVTSELILDMKEVTYISSAGLRVLLGSHKKMSKVGGMMLTGVCDTVMDVLEMTGFADILVIE